MPGLELPLDGISTPPKIAKYNHPPKGTRRLIQPGSVLPRVRRQAQGPAGGKGQLGEAHPQTQTSLLAQE